MPDINWMALVFVFVLAGFLGCLGLIGLLSAVVWGYVLSQFLKPTPSHSQVKTKSPNSQDTSKAQLEQKVWESNIMRFFLTPVFLIGVYLLLALAVTIIFRLTTGIDISSVIGCFSLAIIIGLGQGIWMIFDGYLKRCSSCGAWEQKHEDEKRRELLSSETGYTTVTRTDEVRNSKGEKVGETSRAEQVRVLTRRYRRHYTCSFCGNHWTDTYETETENFKN